jgi:hypothetical protein
MKNAIGMILTALLCCVAFGASAATEQLTLTAYSTVTKLGEKITLPNGSVIMSGQQTYTAVVNDKTGEQTSQFCDGDQWVNDKGAPQHEVAHCSVFYDNGDILWISIIGTTNDQPLTWAVLGGTGKYAGATGGGTSKMVSQRGDGYSGTYKATGTVTTK